MRQDPKHCARCQQSDQRTLLYQSTKREWFCLRCLTHLMGDTRLTAEEVGRDDR
jgi:hypothetical protein